MRPTVAMSQPNNEIRSRIEAFAADLTDLVQKAALEAVVSALGGPRAASRPFAAPAGRAAAHPASKAVAAKAAPVVAKKASGSRPKGAKRLPTEIVKTTQRLSDFIRSTPGQGIEAIGKSLAIATKDLTLPIKKLLAEGSIVAKGERRATKYFPG